jgi:hypothetical protein
MASHLPAKCGHLLFSIAWGDIVILTRTFVKEWNRRAYFDGGDTGID